MTSESVSPACNCTDAECPHCRARCANDMAVALWLLGVESDRETDNESDGGAERQWRKTMGKKRTWVGWLWEQVGVVPVKQHFDLQASLAVCRYVLIHVSGHVDSEELQKAVEQALHDTAFESEADDD